MAIFIGGAPRSGRPVRPERQSGRWVCAWPALPQMRRRDAACRAGAASIDPKAVDWQLKVLPAPLALLARPQHVAVAGGVKAALGGFGRGEHTADEDERGAGEAGFLHLPANGGERAAQD